MRAEIWRGECNLVPGIYIIIDLESVYPAWMLLSCDLTFLMNWVSSLFVDFSNGEPY